MNKKKLLRKAKVLAEKRGLEDKLVLQKSRTGYRYFNPYRNFIKSWVKIKLREK